MTEQAGNSDLEKWGSSVDAELYEDLLDRYERVLLFAGYLRERLNQQKLLSERNRDLERESERLRRLVSAGESYIEVLERALADAGLMGESDRAQ